MTALKTPKMLVALFFFLFAQISFSQDLLIKSFNQIESLKTSKISDIVQSHEGFIWFIADAQVYRFDGFELTELSEIVATESLPLSQVIGIKFDAHNKLWISTKEYGLFIYDGKKVFTPHWQQSISFLPSKPILEIIFEQQKTWLIGSSELVLLEQNKTQHFSIPLKYHIEESNFKNAQLNENNQILIASKTQLLSFDAQNNKFTEIDFSSENENPYIWYVQTDSIKQTWLATDSGAYLFKNKQWIKIKPDQLNLMIKSIAFSTNSVWFATALNGLAEYIPSTDQLIWHQQQDAQHTLLSNNLQQISTDNNGLLWLTYFHGNLSLFDPDQRSALAHANCSTSSIYYGFTENDNFKIFLTADAIVIKDKFTNSCEQVATMKALAENHEGFTATEVFIDSTQRVWIGSASGLIELNAKNKKLHGYNFLMPGKAIKTISEINQDQLLIGSIDGLYIFNKADQSFNNYNINNPLSSAMFFSQSQNQNKSFFITNKGLIHLDQFGLELSKNIIQKMDTRLLTSLAQNEETLFVGTQSKGVFAYDLKQQTGHYLNLDLDVANHIVNLVLKPSGNLLINHQNGIVAYNIAGGTYTNLTEKAGLKNSKFIESSSFESDDHISYIGTTNGFVKFLDVDFHPQEYRWPLQITEIKRFNKTVIVNGSNDGFNLSQSITNLDQIELTHKDYVMEFQFSYLDYLKPDSYDFAYQLANFEPNWNEVSSAKRFASYTNLPAGQYELLLKIKQSNGQWSEPLRSLVIKVKPAPWLSIWAFVTYAILLFGLVLLYIRWKIQSNLRISQRLRTEVKEKTKELNAQKQKVESLLIKKNELFSNVSHEFRTPLTLILGPIKELLNKQVDHEDTRSLKMINRSANRLLSLVEQLLQIARVSDSEQVKTTPQNTQNQVASLVESFQYLAESKHIKLDLKHNDQATIDVTDQFIDAVLGNLLSNAIKYTQSGGHVEVTSETTDDTLMLSVKDSGAGLTAEQQKDIFKRFKRLDSHQTIEGIGIGLSVVEEVVKVNNGDIQVTSELGVGSEFIVRIPLAEAVAEIESTHISTLIEQLQNESFAAKDITTSATSPSENKDLYTVLVIEDNHDMREHIISIVSPHYNCLSAENGVKGVAAAIEEVPDIIISDVMMPEMDGFKVARVIRTDQRTSHIPLMLLTALNDKVSRIKGWRENVDAYMAKPFDRDELLVQLDNMLTIRDILKNKAGQQVKSGNSTAKFLPKKDQEFVDQLLRVIEENYMDPILNRAKIASKMAVSDRQLQRKIKALIDQNPMDMLREFRLNKSKELLKDGYQVGIVADNCGFNSVSYFSQCFKAQFGVTAKKYQQT